MITIGMPSYRNPSEVWFTVMALRMYQDLSNTEILVIDNAGDDRVQKVARDMRVRCEVYTERQGTSAGKDGVFELAKGEFVLCMDSHILLAPGVVAKLRAWVAENWEDARNLIHGPMMYDSMKKYSHQWLDTWRGNMWGVWDQAQKQLPEEPLEIDMAACGLMGCRKDAWLGFAPECRGFGGQAGVIHAKYHKANRKVLILPWLVWAHNFHRETVPYPVHRRDIIRNYLYGFDDAGLDTTPIYEHYGQKQVEEIYNGMSR